MKKLVVFPFIFLLLFTSCVQQSKSCDIFDFSERINKSFSKEVFDVNKLAVSEKNVIYWFPETDKNAVVSFYVNEKTGNIEKCTVVFNSEKANEILKEKVKETLFFNNPYMSEKNYKTEKYISFIFEDSRYKKENTQPKLKKEIKEEDLY